MRRDDRLTRREFVRISAISTGALAAGAAGFMTACDVETVLPPAPTGAPRPNVGGTGGPRYPLKLPSTMYPYDAPLVAGQTVSDVGGGQLSPVWTYNGQFPAPTIRARRNDVVRIPFRNDLEEETTVHWHGLLVPTRQDGHPHYANVPKGESYDFRYEIHQRAGTFWYHPHPHGISGRQAFFGMAGLYLVEDPEEQALGLPAGEYEIPLLVRDVRFDSNGHIEYNHVHDGVLGPVPMVNGTRDPYLEVNTAEYRFRVVSVANARIFRLALSNGMPFRIIGNDGGLLETPVVAHEIWLAPAERVDLLVDFSTLAPGERVMLESLPFATNQGDVEFPQGMPMDLLEFRLVGRVTRPSTALGVLSAIDHLSNANVANTRTFRFVSESNTPSINGRTFDMERIDFRVPFGVTERWRFVHVDGAPHPIHVHGAHFEVETRRGGRGVVFPYERGLKDTVLLFPGEEVDVLIRFDRHRQTAADPGVFLLHCHNLEHEDTGMMLNFRVV